MGCDEFVGIVQLQSKLLCYNRIANNYYSRVESFDVLPDCEDFSRQKVRPVASVQRTGTEVYRQHCLAGFGHRLVFVLRCKRH